MLKEKPDIQKLLFEICEDKRVFEEGIDLIDSGLLDSLALIELFGELEDRGIFLQSTRIDRKKLRTVRGIESLVEEYLKEN